MGAPTGGVRAGLGQIALFVGALLAYQAVRGVAVGEPDDASRNALEVLGVQAALGIGIEPAVQGWALARVGLAEALSALYLGLHLPVTALMLVWLWRRRRDAYVPVRNVFLAANALALAVYALYPVAPPRLVAASGLVDVIAVHSGVDLHGGLASGLFNPYAAVPSMHVAYAALVGIVGWRLAVTPALRLAAVAYPAFVAFMVVATGNHYVLDGVAGVAMLGGGALVAALCGLPWRIPAGSARVGAGAAG